MHRQHHTPYYRFGDYRFGDLNFIWWRLLRTGLMVVNRLRAAGGQSRSDFLRKKALLIALCVWGVGALTLWWLGHIFVTESTEVLFAGLGFLVAFFYVFALGPIADFFEQRMCKGPQD